MCVNIIDLINSYFETISILYHTCLTFRKKVFVCPCRGSTFTLAPSSPDRLGFTSGLSLEDSTPGTRATSSWMPVNSFLMVSGLVTADLMLRPRELSGTLLAGELSGVEELSGPGGVNRALLTLEQIC